MSNYKELRMHTHFILDNELFRVLRIVGVPRLGDEVRICNNLYLVVKVVWCLDETIDSGTGRVNIAIERVKD